MPNEESWELESGLLDNYDFEVTDAYFATDPRYQGGETWLLHWEGQATTEEGNVQDHTLIIGLGQGWTSEDGGKTVVHEKGKEKFNQSSRYGRVIARCSKPEADNYLGDDCRRVLVSRGTPREAAIWNGLKFHIDRETIKFGKGLDDREWELPTAFIGVAGVAGKGARPASAATPTATTTSTATASPPATASASTSNGATTTASDKVLKARLKKLARESADHSEFFDKATDIPGVMDDEEILAMISDEDGLFAEARG